MGRASGFELRHPWLLHNGLLLASVLPYWIDREDVVWRFIKAAPHVRLVEHLCFGSAAVLIALGIWLGSRAAFHNFKSRSNESTERWGGVLYAAGPTSAARTWVCYRPSIRKMDAHSVVSNLRLSSPAMAGSTSMGSDCTQWSRSQANRCRPSVKQISPLSRPTQGISTGSSLFSQAPNFLYRSPIARPEPPGPMYCVRFFLHDASSLAIEIQTVSSSSTPSRSRTEIH